MTDTSKDAVERLLDGVTPGPLVYRPHELDDWGIVKAGTFVLCQARDPAMMDDSQLAQCRSDGADPWADNAHFIAAARELVPALLAEREALTAEVARLTEALRPFVVYVHDDFRRGNGQYALIACAGVGGGWIGAEDLRAAKQAFAAHAARLEGGV